MSLAQILISALVSLLGVIVVSYVVEALRTAPTRPEKLAWASGIPIQYADIAGIRIRYIKAGTGPHLVLLHTLRTQLDLFEKVVPSLTRSFTVSAMDYPGHGYSDIPKARYDADFFVRYVEEFLRALDLREVTLCGVSIGGAIALVVAGRRNARVVRVAAVNPYDYGEGRGMARSSLLGRLITAASKVPVVAGTVMRLRSSLIMKAVLRGGVANPGNIPPALLKEMYEVGNRPGHYRAFISLLRNAASWEAASEIYRRIDVPVNLIWGAEDWSTPLEREHDRSLIPQVQVTTLQGGGHFLPLDRPDAFITILETAAGSKIKSSSGEDAQ